MPRKVRVRDLKPGQAYGLLLCVGGCGGEWSADSGDYFMARPEKVLECCGEPMQLVRKVTTYKQVEA